MTLHISYKYTTQRDSVYEDVELTRNKTSSHVIAVLFCPLLFSFPLHGSALLSTVPGAATMLDPYFSSCIQEAVAQLLLETGILALREFGQVFP